MLKLLGWIEVRSDDYEHIRITEVGRKVHEKLLDTSAIIAIESDTDNNMPLKISKDQPKSHSDSTRSGKLDSGFVGNATRRIMVVDDERDILLTYQSFLSTTGYEVQAFSDAYSALHEFTLRPSYYDLVLLDIRMPNLNGLQMYQSFKVINPSCRIIFVTALDAAKEMASILPGVTSDNIIGKPIEEESFLRKIHAILK